MFSDAATFTIPGNKIPCPGGVPITTIYCQCDEPDYFGIRESESESESESECGIEDTGGVGATGVVQVDRALNPESGSGTRVSQFRPVRSTSPGLSSHRHPTFLDMPVA